MKLHNLNTNQTFKSQNLCLCIGNFDGIHLGHQHVIKKIIKNSQSDNLKSAIMTFVPHPKIYFKKTDGNFNIITNNYKKIFLNSLKNIKLGDNKPYSGRLKNDTLYKHASSHGIPHVLIELRQDLLKKEKEKLQWAKKIHNVLKENEKTIKSFSLQKYGSYTFKGE